MSAINVGLLGFGNAGRVFHAPLIQAEPRLRLRQIGSRSFDDKTLPSGVVGRGIDDVIADPDIDLIVIATPNNSHAPLAKQALGAGKHVVIDKPFALTTAEAGALVAAAEKSGKVLSVFQNRRWDGGFLTARNAIADGRLGEISYAAFHFDRYSPAIKDRWREWDVPGAGILYDLGPHLIDQIYCLFGTPDAVTATVARQRAQARVDDFFDLVFEFGTVRVVAHASSLMPDHTPRISLFGSRASLFQLGFDGQEDALKRGVTPGQSGWGDTPGGQAYLMTADGTRTDLAFLQGRYEAYYANIADAICHNTPLDVTPSDALIVIRALEAAITSAQSGQRIQIATHAP